jgi:CHASE2 domain-containing sensor protein
MKIRWLNSFTVALAVTILSLYLYSLDLAFFQLLEVKAYDFKVSSREARPVSGNVVVVAVDETSLEQEKGIPNIP